MTRIALLVAIIFICAQITIPFGGIPMTLQTFAVAICGILLGIRKGIVAIMIYLLLGAIGIPVFAGFGGTIGFLFGPTGGFLFGFLPLAVFCGMQTKWKLQAFFCDLCGLIICHMIGIFWFVYVSQTSLITAFLFISLPYLLKDIFCIIFARFLVEKMRQRCPQLFLFEKVS